MSDGMTSEATVPEAVTRGDKLTQLYEHNYTPDGDMRAAAVDLVCDVLHAAEARGDDPEALLQSAAHHWASEREGADSSEVAARHPAPDRQEEGGTPVQRLKGQGQGIYTVKVSDQWGGHIDTLEVYAGSTVAAERLAVERAKPKAPSLARPCIGLAIDWRPAES